MHLLMMNTKMADRIFTFLDSVKLEKKKDISNIELKSIDNIEFKNLSFSYDDRKVLNNINLSIIKGSLFAIAGESGLGKSTFAKVLFKNLMHLYLTSRNLLRISHQLIFLRNNHQDF